MSSMVVSSALSAIPFSAKAADGSISIATSRQVSVRMFGISGCLKWIGLGCLFLRDQNKSGIERARRGRSEGRPVLGREITPQRELGSSREPDCRVGLRLLAMT